MHKLSLLKHSFLEVDLAFLHAFMDEEQLDIESLYINAYMAILHAFVDMEQL